MNIWTILGIEPTHDKSLIKKAYFKKLRVTNPEDNPKDFQNLRAAYESANQYADHQEALSEKINYQYNTYQQIHLTYHSTPVFSDSRVPRKLNKSSPHYLQRLAYKLIDHAQLNEDSAIRLFTKIMNTTFLQDINSRMLFSIHLQNVLVNLKKIPFKMVFALYQHFKWDLDNYAEKESIELSSIVNTARAIHYMQEIKANPSKKLSKTRNIINILEAQKYQYISNRKEKKVHLFLIGLNQKFPNMRFTFGNQEILNHYLHRIGSIKKTSTVGYLAINLLFGGIVLISYFLSHIFN